MNNKEKKILLNQIDNDLKWLDEKYKIIDLPNWSAAHIYDSGGEKDTLIFASVPPPFDVIHVPNIKYFENKFRVVAFRRNESLTHPITPIDRAKEIISLMDYLKIKKAHFCGLNEGAIASFYITKIDQERVKSIVCTCIGIDNLLTKFQIRLTKHLPINPGAYLIGKMVKWITLKNACDNFLVAYLWSKNPHAKKTLINGVIPLYEKYEVPFSSLRMPILNIQSSPVVEYYSAKRLIEMLYDGQLEEIPGNSHLCMYTFPEQFNSIMEDFYINKNFY